MTISFEQTIQILQNQPITPESGDDFAKLDYEMTHSAQKVSMAVEKQFEQLRMKFANARLECRLTLEAIQPVNFFTIGGNFFDITALIDGILTQDEIQNPLDRQHLSEKDLAKVCAHFGVDVNAFKELWPKAKQEYQAHNDLEIQKLPTDHQKEEYLRREGAAEEESNYKRDARKRLFNELTKGSSLTLFRVAKIAMFVLLALAGIALCYVVGRTFLWNRIQLPSQ